MERKKGETPVRPSNKVLAIPTTFSVFSHSLRKPRKVSNQGYGSTRLVNILYFPFLSFYTCLAFGWHGMTWQHKLESQQYNFTSLFPYFMHLSPYSGTHPFQTKTRMRYRQISQLSPMPSNALYLLKDGKLLQKKYIYKEMSLTWLPL